MSFWEIVQAMAPELIIAFGATELLMHAAWGKDRARTNRTVTILSVALLALATCRCSARRIMRVRFSRVSIAPTSSPRSARRSSFRRRRSRSSRRTIGSTRDAEHSAEYPVLILFSALGMSVMVSSSNLITLYIGVELQSLAAYVLASYRRYDERSAEAGLKYFVLGALASGILLYGISLLYGFTGTMSYSGIAAALAARRRGIARVAARRRVPARRHRLQDQRSAVPHVDARRL
jgi:NADH-quinone oxidoreductase subunit N